MNLKNKFKKFFTLRKGAEDGFTLVELVVVIAILGILAAVSIPAYDQYIEYVENNNDQQLVAAANRAFAAACIEAKYDSIDMASASVAVKNLKITGLSGVTHATKEITNDEKVNIATNFMLYMLGNENLQLKNESVKSLVWNEDHFEINTTNVAVPEVMLSNGSYATLDQIALNNIADSYIGELNEEELALLLDSVKTNSKDALLQVAGDKIASIIGTGTYNTVKKFLNEEQLGVLAATFTEGIKTSNAFSEATLKSIQSTLINPFASNAKKEEAVNKFANGMLLYTADVLYNEDPGKLYAAVKKDYFTEGANIVNTGGNGGTAVSAAVRESVFQGYIRSENGAKDYAAALEKNQGDATKAAEELKNQQGFKDYINSPACETDIAGLIGTMQTVHDNYESIGKDKLANEGMTNEDVQNLFGQITGY